jgi:opacity protein-like surface antigen
MPNTSIAPRGLVAGLIALACVLPGASPASAEWIADIFVGSTFTKSDDVKVDSPAGRGTIRDVGFDTAVAGGIRVGKYFDGLPFLGVAVDGFRFSPYIAPQSAQFEGCFVVGGCGTRQGGTGSFDVTVTTISFDLMLRAPLFTTPELPRGRVQPYVAAGVPLVLTEVSPNNTRLFRNHASDTDVTIGYKAAAGVAIEVYNSLAVFFEYRFNHASVDADLQDSVSASTSAFRTDISSHSTLIGVSARW